MDVVSGVVGDLLIEALTGIILGFLTNIGVGVLVDLNKSADVGAMNAFEFVMSGMTAKKFRC